MWNYIRVKYMDNSIENIKKYMGNKWGIFCKIHDTLITFEKDISFRVFPIYISYCRGTDIFAVLYFRQKFADEDNLTVGLNLKHKPKLDIFKDGSVIKYSGINYFLSFNSTDNFNEDIINAIRESM